MGVKTYTQIVLEELQNSLSGVSEDSLNTLADEIRTDCRIFCDGAGRSRLQVEGFAMRLIQMGFQAAIVGEPTVPAIRKRDVLLICSASGETPILIAHAQKAKALGAKLLLITASAGSSLAALCDCRIVLNASSKSDVTDVSIQPMGSLFEQSVGILMDSLVLSLMEKHQITNSEMYGNHANLE